MSASFFSRPVKCANEVVIIARGRNRRLAAMKNHSNVQIPLN